MMLWGGGDRDVDEHDVYDHRSKIPSASSSVLAAATLPSSSSSAAAAATAASVTDLLNGRGSSSAATTASPPLSEDNDASSLMGGGGGSSQSQSQQQPPLDLPPDLPPPPPPEEPPPPPDQPPPGSVVDHYSDLTVRVGSLDDGTSTHDGSSVNLQQSHHHHHHHPPLHHLHHLHDHHHHHHDSNGGLGLTPEDAAAMEQLHQSMLAEQQQQFQYLQHLHDSNVNDLSALMVGGNGNGVGMGCANSNVSGRMRHPMNETSLMLMASSSEADHVKLPTAKERSNYLIRYARKFGLNDRGCYLSCGLAALAFVLFVAIIIIVANWPASPHRHTGPLHYCSQPPCLTAAAGILDKVNASYDPCKQFYKFACDGWMTKEHIPVTKSSWSTLEASEARIRREKSRLVTISSHEPSQFNSVEWKVQKFYGSCMALGFIDIDREKPLVKIINSLGGWEVLRSFNLYSWDSHRVLRELHAEHNVDAFFRLAVAPDSRDPSRAVITVSPGGLGMPHRSYYHRLPDDPAVAAYQTFLKDSAQLFGASSPDAHKFSVDMFNFEKRLSEITPEADYLSDPSRTSNHMSVKDLHTVSMNIPWLEILKAAYPEAPMSEETEVVVVSPQYVADIAVIMSTTDRASLNNYLMWRLVQSYMPFLSKTYREVVDLYRKALEGAQKPLERWEFCQLTTERFFGQLLGSMYTKEQSQLRERATLVNKLFDYIKHNVAKAMSVSPAYDYASRRAAMSKLQNMSIQVGTPDFLMDAKYLKLLYKDLLVQKTDFFQNIQYGVMFLRKRQEMTLVSPSEESRWVDLLLDWRRVGYSPSANKVVVPESFLLPPFFHVGYPNSVNLGGLGVRLAEAVISGVAGHGLLFNADGVLQVSPGQNVTSSGSLGRPLLAFQEDARCLTEQLSSLGVDTPDFLRKCQRSAAVQVSALRQTLASLQDILELERGQILPALEERDPPALFFLSHAQTLCEQKSIRRRDVDRAVGQELLGKERLAAELAQVPQFLHFYFCSEEEGEEQEGLCRGIM